jgi:tRNA pseudouridine55 synthase
MVPAARSPERDIQGLVLLDKPRGLSSNQALQHVKRLFQAAKAGHTGSLDPLATGMLPICLGAATKVCGYLLDARKTYTVTAELGVATTTGDAEGEVIDQPAGAQPTQPAVAAALAQFCGEREQIPPMHSAIKRDGVPLYRLARRGIEVERKPRRITVYALDLVSYVWPQLTLRLVCSKGTYVRTLVTDLAAALQTVGHVQELRRLSVDPYTEDEQRTFELLERRLREGGLEALDRELKPIDSALPAWPQITLDDERAERLLHGQSVAADPDWADGENRVYGRSLQFLALADVTSDRQLVPRRVFAR